jgi:DNA-binding PadR family transcriptional regulator
MSNNPSSALGLAVLSLLVERPMHPYEMASTLRRRETAASIKVTYGTLYSVIRALTAAGLVAPRRTERNGGRPERTIYMVTAAGEADLRQRLRDLLRAPAKEYGTFGAALALMTVLPPEEVASLLAERAALLDEAAIQLRHGLEHARQAGVPRLATIEREHELTIVEAERAWASGLSRLVRKSAAFTRHWPPGPDLGRRQDVRDGASGPGPPSRTRR